MTYNIPVYKPSLFGNEKKYVLDCLDTTWISSKGKYIELFEDSFKKFVGIKYASAVSNGTVALHLALLALDISKDDEVLVPTFTYIASVNAISYTGAKPVFVDSEKDTWQIDPADIRKRITKKTKAILVVHLYGHPCNMNEICKIAKEFGLYIIEDSAEAIGSKIGNKHVGTFGDISTFSFFGNKTITTGEGGMVITNDKKLHDRVIHFKGQGLAQNREYWHDVIGYNYRMTNICAAIGCAQIENIDVVIKKKREIAEFYKKHLSNSPILFHEEQQGFYHSYWMVTILVRDSYERTNLRKFLDSKGIETRPTFSPIHSMPMYIDNNQMFPIADNLGMRGINLPSFPDLTIEELTFICENIIAFYNGNC